MTIRLYNTLTRRKEEFVPIRPGDYELVPVRDGLEVTNGYRVVGTTSSGSEAIKLASQTSPDVVLMDISLHGEMDGIEAAEAIRSWHDIPVIFLTAFADEQSLQRAKATNPFGYILKPFDQRSLYTTIEMAMNKHQLEKRLRDNEEMLRTLVENQGEGVVIVDSDENLTYANPAAERLFPDLGEMGMSHPLLSGLTGPIPDLRKSGPLDEICYEAEVGAATLTEPDRAGLGKEQRDAETHGHGDQQRDERGHQRAVDHHQAAELLLHRVPVLRPQESDSEFPDRRRRADEERDDDAGQQGQRQPGRTLGECREQAVGPGGVVPAGRRLAARMGSLHIASVVWGGGRQYSGQGSLRAYGMSAKQDDHL